MAGVVAHKILVSAPVPLELILTGDSSFPFRQVYLNFKQINGDDRKLFEQFCSSSAMLGDGGGGKLSSLKVPK